MICPHCKTQWQLPAGSDKNFTKCPFCDGDLYASIDASYTVEMTLKEIVARFGVDILSNSSELIFAFGSVAPHLEKEIQGLLLFEACGGVNNFLNLQGAGQEEIATVYANQVKQMTDTITKICNGFLGAIGLSVEVDNVSTVETESAGSAVEWEYVNLGNETIEIIACKDQLPAEIVFPSYIDGKKVVSIGSAVLGAAKTKGAERLRVESVHLPQGITSIGSSVFAGCKALKEVVLSKGLSSIGDNAFQNCKALTNISIPDSVSYIGSGAFSGSNIQSIVLPGGIGNVPEDAFKNCKKLISVTILEGVSSIQRAAFDECKALTSVNLPQSLVAIERDAFHCCGALKNIVLPDSIKIIGYQAFEWCSLTIETLPASLTAIENSSFEGCDFRELTVPDGVREIGDYAFNQCWQLRKIKIPKSVVKIGKEAFFNIKSEVTIVCCEDSYAHKWAQNNKVMFELM